MTTVKFSYEGGSNGSNVASGAGAGTGDTNFNTVQRGTSATNAYDNTHPGRGSLGVKIATGATSTTAYDAWASAFGTQTTVYIRMLCYFTANPAANTRVFQVQGSSTTRAQIVLNSNGKLLFQDANSVAQLTATPAIPLNATFRLEAKLVLDATVGQWEYKVWNDPRDVGTPNDTQTSSANLNTGGAGDNWRFGISVNIANAGPYWLDDVALSTDGYIGPEDPRVTGTGNVNAKKSSLDAVDKSTVSGGPRLKKMVVSASSVETSVVSGGPRLKKMTVAISTTQKAVVSGGPRLKKMVIGGTSVVTTNISGSLQLHKMVVSGTVTQKAVIFGGPHLKKMVFAGSVYSFDMNISGGPHLKKMRISGSVIQKTVVSGGPRLKKMRISSATTEIAVVTGAIRLHKMRMSISSIETSIVTDAMQMKKMHVHVSLVRPHTSQLMTFTPV